MYLKKIIWERHFFLNLVFKLLKGTDLFSCTCPQWDFIPHTCLRVCLAWLNFNRFLPDSTSLTSLSQSIYFRKLVNYSFFVWDVNILPVSWQFNPGTSFSRTWYPTFWNVNSWEGKVVPLYLSLCGKVGAELEWEPIKNQNGLITLTKPPFNFPQCLSTISCLCFSGAGFSLYPIVTVFSEVSLVCFNSLVQYFFFDMSCNVYLSHGSLHLKGTNLRLWLLSLK